MVVAERYLRNLGALTPEQQHSLSRMRVCVVGCGGLGGHLIELLARLGVGHLTVVDGDCFDSTNLNRQLLCTQDRLGTSKASAAKQHIAAVNPLVTVDAVCCHLTRDNGVDVLTGHDLVMDGLDSGAARRLLQHFCAQLEIPIVHGAVEGWGVQISVVYPGDDTLSRLYPEGSPECKPGGTLAPVVAFAAALQVSEALKVLLDTAEPLRGKILFADLLSNRMDILPI